jgi:sterol desaturase/sphingolipid hydroxylase (fatty acid hydroxylase superfamily)
MAATPAAGHLTGDTPLALRRCAPSSREEHTAMMPLTAVLWLIVGTACAGIVMLLVLTVPAWADGAMQWLPIAAIAGFVAALPIAMAVARRCCGAGPRRI